MGYKKKLLGHYTPEGISSIDDTDCEACGS